VADRLPDRFARHLAETGLLEGAGPLAVACSGGGDSTALLVLARAWAVPRGIGVVVLHVAHGLRGEAGLLDARFCANLAARLGVPYGFLSVDVPSQRKKGESIESAARRLRYRALLSVAGEMGAAVLTGHTRDDQAETVLLHLERRLGRARGGIRATRPDGVVRPLLPFSRAELRAFLDSEGVPWREDETNANEGFARNRVRRKVLPGLERRMPGATERLARAGEAYSRRLDALDERLDRAMAEEKVFLEGKLPREFFGRLSDEEAARLLIRMAGAAGGGGGGGGGGPPPPPVSRSQASRKSAAPPAPRSRVPRVVCGPEAHRQPTLCPSFTF
jgi:tRNA(Ile)-lysidine synthase